MAQSLPVDIGTGFYQSEALPLANQRCVNGYPDNPQTQALTTSAVFGTPGIVSLASSSSFKQNSNRGAWVKSGVPYFVNGDKISSLSDNHVLTELGTIEGTARCSFADNGKQLLVLVPGGKGYIVDETTSPLVQEITDTDFTTTNGKPQYVVYIDGYFVVTTDENKFKNSSLNDGFTWSALDFGSAEADPDGIVAPFVFKNQLYITGGQTIETFTNIGGAGFPFQRINGFIIDKGVKAPSSIQVFNESVFWVGKAENESIAVYQLNGSNAVKVSTTAIDNKLQDLTEAQQAAIFSWSYAQRGHYFIGFTSELFTFVFDMTTGKWHERESEITSELNNTTTQRCRYNSVVQAYGKLLVGDSQDGRVGELNLDCYDEYGESLRCFFTTSPLFNLGNSFSIPKLEIFCQPGVGNSVVRDPVVNMRVSKDGYVFQDYKKVKIGAPGEYNKRQIGRYFGRVNRYCVFEFLISDAVERRFMGLTVFYKPGVRGG